MEDTYACSASRRLPSCIPWSSASAYAFFDGHAWGTLSPESHRQTYEEMQQWGDPNGLNTGWRRRQRIVFHWERPARTLLRRGTLRLLIEVLLELLLLMLQLLDMQRHLVLLFMHLLLPVKEPQLLLLLLLLVLLEHLLLDLRISEPLVELLLDLLCPICVVE